jgi:hypothetical protein
MSLFLDFDMRISSTSQIINSISETINKVSKEMEYQKEQYFIEESILLLEDLYGITFVVAQVYITGTVSDIKTIGKGVKNISKELLLNQYSELLPGNKITKMELCDALANYCKHHDEWGNWSSSGRHQKTVSILNSVGINQFESIVFDQAIGLLWPENKNYDINQLIILLEDWRKRVVASYRKFEN